MKILNDSQRLHYQKNGFLLENELFMPEEISVMVREIPKLYALDVPQRIMEKTGAIRSFFGADKLNATFGAVTRLKRLVNRAEDLLGDSVYIHQTKINVKQALLGDWWEWHQDFPYWNLEDAMPQSNVLTAMIFLDNVDEFNGPMLVIPGSHLAGQLDYDSNSNNEKCLDSSFEAYQNSTTYMSALTSNLKYTITQPELAQWVAKRGIQSMKGKAGTVLFFHGLIFHASSNNMSPYDRKTFLITYNGVNNHLEEQVIKRPEFLANRDFTPINAF